MKLDNIIKVSCRDICGKFREDEAGFDDISAHSIDAVFLDIPEPWLALPFALQVLKPSRNICCYSPCIEQVMKTCEVLRDLGFYNVSTVEVKQRLFDGKYVQLENCDLGQDNLMTSESSSMVNNDKGSEIEDSLTIKNSVSTECESSNDEKRQKIIAPEDLEDGLEIEMNTDESQNKKPVYNHNQCHHIKQRKLPPSKLLVSRPVSRIKGHSAFLTFAICPTLEMSRKKLDVDKSQRSNDSKVESQV